MLPANPAKIIFIILVNYPEVIANGFEIFGKMRRFCKTLAD